jgi:lysozyme
MKWEGFAAKPYLDPASIKTGCFGETEDPAYLEDRIYSRSECGDQLRKRLARDYAPRIAKCLPEIVQNRFVFGALLDASYNAGWAAVCNSRMAVSVRAGNLRAACNGLEGWYVTARNRQTGVRVRLRGLERRRLDEKATCLRGLA